MNDRCENAVSAWIKTKTTSIPRRLFFHKAGPTNVSVLVPEGALAFHLWIEGNGMIYKLETEDNWNRRREFITKPNWISPNIR